VGGFLEVWDSFVAETAFNVDAPNGGEIGEGVEGEEEDGS